MNAARSAPRAHIRLAGHPSVTALLEVSRDPAWAWLTRTFLVVAAGAFVTILTLWRTWDPFVASFPLVLGMGMVYLSARGRYTVRSFQGVCPGCGGPLSLEEGARIGLPQPLVCDRCHERPELTV